MAGEENQAVKDPEISSTLDFSADELDALEAEFREPEQEVGEAGDELEEEAEEGEAEEGEEEEEGESETEGEEEGEEEGDEEGESAEETEEAEGEGGEEAEEEQTQYELTVDGQRVVVEGEDNLAAWAQKGIHYEKKDRERQRVVDDAVFTMNALINDPMASLEEIWTSKFGGNNEQARLYVAQLASDYCEPIWREQTAKPADRLKLQQERFEKRQQQLHAQQQKAAEGQFSQEDIQFIQTLDSQIEGALEEVGLPKENATLRKWMADVMRDGLDRGIPPDPRAAAHYIKAQQDERQKALGETAPDKDRKKPKSKKDKAAAKIAQARKRRSSRQGGQQPQQSRKQEPRFMTTREFLDGMNRDLRLEP